MECPDCHWQNSPEHKFCVKCGLFLLEPQTRYTVASYGNRVGAYLLDIPLSIVTLGIGWLIWNIVVMTKGQNPGKQLVGMYIINSKGEPIGFWHQALLRALVGMYVLGGMTLGVYTIVDFLWPLWDRNNQALHDKVAGTFVVRRPAQR